MNGLHMSKIQIKDEELNKVSGGKGEYNSVIDDVTSLKQDLNNRCASINTFPDFKSVITSLEGSINDLTYNNTESAKRQLSNASQILADLSTKYKDLESALLSFMNQLVYIITRI